VDSDDFIKALLGPETKTLGTPGVEVRRPTRHDLPDERVGFG